VTIDDLVALWRPQRATTPERAAVEAAR
jgi:hypothetical protein